MFLTNDSMVRGAGMFLTNVSLELPASCPAASPDTLLTEAGRLHYLVFGGRSHSVEAMRICFTK